LLVVATIRQRRPGVWEVRGYTGKDVAGELTQERSGCSMWRRRPPSRVSARSSGCC